MRGCGGVNGNTVKVNVVMLCVCCAELVFRLVSTKFAGQDEIVHSADKVTSSWSARKSLLQVSVTR